MSSLHYPFTFRITSMVISARARRQSPDWLDRAYCSANAYLRYRVSAESSSAVCQRLMHRIDDFSYLYE